MHATARSNVAHNFLKLKAGEIYSVKNFSVQPNKDEFRIFKDAPFIVEFYGETIVRKAFVNLMVSSDIRLSWWNLKT
nr:hypothetical protein [Tanacetum cinerariifolium]